MEIFSLIFLIIFTALAQASTEEENIKKCTEQQEGRVRMMMDELTALNEWKDINDATQNFLLSKPCLVRQYLASKNLFNIDKNKWNMQSIVDTFGDDAYNYCRYELERRGNGNANGCNYAVKGLMCLLKANRNVCETRINLINCIYELGANNEQLLEYSEFPEKEKIPCLFKCFADKMKLYNANFSWNLDNWVRAFGPMKYANPDFNECKTSQQRIQNDISICDWMYEEHMCLERLNYNTHGTECSCAKNAAATPKSIVASSSPERSIKSAFFTAKV